MPRQASGLIGRRVELAEAVRLLGGDVRLLTLTGVGGTGKTRLAIEVASELAPGFPGGVHFVDLSQVAEPSGVAARVASALDVRDAGEQPLHETLRLFLRDRELLLVLDNFEHLLPAATFVAGVLAECPRVKVLATSRAPLHISWEREMPVPPLALPVADQRNAARVGQSAAVALFVERTRAVRPDFALTEDNAADVAEICVRLDGLPLAIELAAARTKVLPPGALREHLGNRLRLLRGNALDRPARHQTLRDAILWSYELLGPTEQRLFRRLAVFVGGFTIESAQQVVEPGVDVLEGIASLVDSSLVQVEPHPKGDARFRMLETVRELGLELVAAAGERADVEDRLIAYFVDLTERADPRMASAEQAMWLDHLELERPNLRAAFDWCQARPDRGELALRLTGAQWLFWFVRGYLGEGRDSLMRALERRGEARADVVGVAMYRLGVLTWSQGDSAEGESLCLEALGICRAVGDESKLAWALAFHGRCVIDQGDNARAGESFLASLELARRLGDDRIAAISLAHLGYIACRRDDLVRARTLCEEADRLARSGTEPWLIAMTMAELANVLYRLGQLDRAQRLQDESLHIKRRLGDKLGIATCLSSLGSIARVRGDVAAAHKLFAEGIELFREVGARSGLGSALGKQAVLVFESGDYQDARALHEQAHAIALECGNKRNSGLAILGLADLDRTEGDIPSALERYRECLALLREAGDTRNLARAEKRLGDLARDAGGQSGCAPGRRSPLTRREEDVAALIVRGLSNRLIAERLIIAERTVDTHVSNILGKLGLSTRAQVAAWATEHGLGTSAATTT